MGPWRQRAPQSTQPNQTRQHSAGLTAKGTKDFKPRDAMFDSMVATDLSCHMQLHELGLSTPSTVIEMSSAWTRSPFFFVCLLLWNEQQEHEVALDSSRTSKDRQHFRIPYALHNQEGGAHRKCVVTASLVQPDCHQNTSWLNIRAQS